ncbi:MAG: M48 family metallopeptidase [Aquificae bacterium]|nr:M48 family metallopeptidase [Aquificota bacterium]
MRPGALFLALLLFLFSCARVVDPLTGEKVLTLLPPEEEIAIGNEFLPEAITQMEGVYADEEVQEYVREIGRKIALHTPRKLPYEFFVVNSSQLNAFALPGGKILITRGLLLIMDDESELAGVLAHELGHVNARHHARYLEKTLGLALLLQIGAVLIGGESRTERLVLQLASIGATLLALKFSRDQEREADRLGLRFMVEAGYDPSGLVEVMEKFKKLEKERPPEWLSTHPLPETRIKELSREIKKMKLPPNLVKNTPRFTHIKERLKKTKRSFELYEEGKKLYKKGQKDRALAKFLSALRVFPKNQMAMVYAGVVYLEKGNPEKALEYANRAVRTDPYLLWGWYLKGIALFKLKRYTESIRALEEAKERVKSYAGIYYYLGRNYEELGKIKKAIENYRLALRLATGKEPWYEDAKRRLSRYGVIF